MPIVILNDDTLKYRLIGVLNCDSFDVKTSHQVLGFNADTIEQVAEFLRSDISKLEALIETGTLGISKHLKEHLELIKGLLSSIEKGDEKEIPSEIRPSIRKRCGNVDYHMF